MGKYELMLLYNQLDAAEGGHFLVFTSCVEFNDTEDDTTTTIYTPQMSTEIEYDVHDVVDIVVECRDIIKNKLEELGIGYDGFEEQWYNSAVSLMHDVNVDVPKDVLKLCDGDTLVLRPIDKGSNPIEAEEMEEKLSYFDGVKPETVDLNLKEIYVAYEKYEKKKLTMIREVGGQSRVIMSRTTWEMIDLLTKA